MKGKTLLIILGVMMFSLLVMASAPGAQSAAPEAGNYRKVTDTFDLLSLQAPLSWSETEAGPWMVNNKEVGVFIAASPDLDGFYHSDQTPGVFFAASRTLAGAQRMSNPAKDTNPAIINLLNSERDLRLKSCKAAGKRSSYADPFYQGQSDLFQSCQDGSSQIQVLVAMPAHQELLLFLVIKTNSPADLEAAAHILDTFQVLNPQLADDHDEH